MRKKKIPSEREGEREEGRVAKELKRSNSAWVKFKIGEKSHEVTAAGRGVRARGVRLRFFLSLPHREKIITISTILRFPCWWGVGGGGTGLFFSPRGTLDSATEL